MTSPRSNHHGTTLAPEAAREEFLKPSQIATRLNVGKMTIYRLIDEGAFPGTIRVGRSFRIPVAAYKAYVKASEVRP